MKWEIFIYDNKVCLIEKEFNNPKEIEAILKQYEGYWCKIINQITFEVILEGAFDDSFLDESYYRN